MPLLHGALTERILAAFYQVHFEMGTGWPESVYSGAMEVMMTEMGLDVRREVILNVSFHDKILLKFFEKPTFKRCFLTNDRKKSRRVPLGPSWSVFKASTQRGRAR